MSGEKDKEKIPQETRAWITVIVVILLAEVGMHEFGHFELSWGLILTLITLAAAIIAFRNYWRWASPGWLLTAGALGLIGLTVLVEAFGVEPLPEVDLSGLLILGVRGPQHGLLGITHLVSDVAVLAIGVHQFVRWYRLRNTGSALGTAAAVTACCGTTAALLAPVFAAIGGALGIFGVHLETSFVIVATILTVALALLGYVWAEGGPSLRFVRRWRQANDVR